MSVHYRALHTRPYYRKRCGYKSGSCPNALRIGETTVSLPLSAKLTDEVVQRVIGATREILGQAA